MLVLDFYLFMIDCFGHKQLCSCVSLGSRVRNLSCQFQKFISYAGIKSRLALCKLSFLSKRLSLQPYTTLFCSMFLLLNRVSSGYCSSVLFSINLEIFEQLIFLKLPNFKYICTFLSIDIKKNSEVQTCIL